MVGIVLITARIHILHGELILSIITYVIAIIICISGLMKVENAIDLKRMSNIRCHYSCCHNMYSFGNFSFNDAQ